MTALKQTGSPHPETGDKRHGAGSETPHRTPVEEALHQAALAWFFAWSDTRARYKRSVLGPFWLVLGTLIGVVGLGVVWSALLGAERSSFIPPLTIGLVLWTMIAAGLTSGTSVFTRNATVIKNIRTPSWRITLELLFQQLVNFVHNLVVIAVVLMVYPADFSPLALLAIPGLILVMINLFWVVQVLGFLGARFRDFEPLMSALVPILFFLSPVLYRTKQLGALADIMAFNPIAYWIDIVRDPILGTVPSFGDYAAVGGMAIAGCAAAAWLTRAKAHRLPYWI